MNTVFSTDATAKAQESHVQFTRPAVGQERVGPMGWTNRFSLRNFLGGENPRRTNSYNHFMQ